ncbi:efflux transporter, RND family, MFP subunit [Pseudomonas aeruginosa]|nr:efflux transporter, RND family, MFP subunit [Pseudomonas aeruginosa]RCM89201.1 Acriflavine resistance protein A precursor [Pseudomonas aeruginosa]
MVLPVEVLTVQAEPLALSSELPGRIEPVRVAEVRARVAGIVVQKRFEEGADVKAGDLLFQIDPAPLKAAVSRAEGELARNRAVLFEAQARVRRYEPLVKIQAVSQQDFDTATADLRSAEAATRSAQADLETARLNLGYASVTAPISGRIGRALVTEGALVGQGEATLMARIQQLDPIYADFTQTAAEALRLREALKKGTLAAGDSQALTLRVEGTPYERQGALQFADVAVDRGTGQIALRGKFANPDGVLLPGMYVRVRTPQGIANRAILVPQRAVRRSGDGSAQVMVVGADERAEARSVGTGVMQGSRWQITEGLEPGDRVIVGGLAAVQPGVKIVPKPDGAQAQAQSSVPQQ